MTPVYSPRSLDGLHGASGRNLHHSGCWGARPGHCVRSGLDNPLWYKWSV